MAAVERQQARDPRHEQELVGNNGLLEKLDRQQVRRASERRPEPSDAGSPCNRDQERRSERAPADVFDADETQHRQHDGDHRRGDHRVGEKRAQDGRDREPHHDLAACSGADADQRDQRDAPIEPPTCPDRGEDVGAEQQENQLFGIRGKNPGDRKEVEDREDDKRKEPGDGQIHRLEDPPPRHPHEEAKAAAHRVVQQRGRENEQE